MPPFELALGSSNQSSSSSSGTKSGKGEQRDMSELHDAEEKRLKVAVPLIGLEADISLLLAEEDLRGTTGQGAVGVLSENVSMASNRESSRSSFSVTAALDFSGWRAGVLGKGVSSGSGIAGGILASGITSLASFTN